MINSNVHFTLRDVEHLATLIAVTPTDLRRGDDEYYIFAGLLIMKVAKPEWIDKARMKELPYAAVLQLFDSFADGEIGQRAYWCWKLCLDKAHLTNEDRVAEDIVGPYFFHEGSSSIVSNIIAQSLDAFELPR
ncbi:hypothetical protein CLV80_10671 [Yoonia maritima]|uniref:Uncharacterized protein n=1 Tax=Yoonia maritima TaxID=1435347 RepID=A0A2T0VY87_9RHOB|nr:hypothetical protein [Yoonia maritima]PRY77227.1 hypothetical protein CLV80_10671 [Yoonia maritima]